jgi:hypothetical protein
MGFAESLTTFGDGIEPGDRIRDHPAWYATALPYLGAAVAERA